MTHKCVHGYKTYEHSSATYKIPRETAWHNTPRCRDGLMTSKNSRMGDPSLNTLEIEQEDSWRWGILGWASRALPQHPAAPGMKLLPGLNLSIYAALQLEPLPVVNKWLPDFRDRGTSLCFIFSYCLLFLFLSVCLSVSVFVNFFFTLVHILSVLNPPDTRIGWTTPPILGSCSALFTCEFWHFAA